jgi:hypothetical protein
MSALLSQVGQLQKDLETHMQVSGAVCDRREEQIESFGRGEGRVLGL